MCLQPVYIRNPFKDRVKNISYSGGVYDAPLLLYSHKDKIQVPCGKCSECRNSYFQSIFQRAVVESRSSYMYFVTLTYDNKHIPCIDIGGKLFYYTDYSDVQLMIKRLRNQNVLDREWRYLCVNEYGDAKLRPHVHLIFFVSKLDTDDVLTPYNIEKILFDNIGPNFAKNVGSKKKPVYEQLFTYRCGWKNGVFRSNYFVKYVDIGDDIQTDTTYKTINYLIGYVNKPQKIDGLLNNLLTTYSDYEFVKRVKNVLSSKVRYSKGFGFGFVNGVKNHLPMVYTSISGARALYTDLKNTLPKTYEEFRDTYRDLRNRVMYFFENTDFSIYSDFADLYNNIDTEGLQCLFIAHIYNLPCLSYLKCLTSQRLTSTIRYFFDIKKGYLHKYSAVTTSPMVANPVVDFIRSGLRKGLNCKMPFLTFCYGDKFQPLCAFYKRTCTTPVDTMKMYKSVGVRNFDEWTALFEEYINDQKSVQQLKNVARDANFSENICISQNLFLDLPQETRNIYQFILR